MVQRRGAAAVHLKDAAAAVRSVDGRDAAIVIGDAQGGHGPELDLHLVAAELIRPCVQEDGAAPR